MKRIITLALVLTTFAATAFADNVTAINQKVISTFNKTFQLAEDVSWEIKSNLYKATFTNNGKKMFAYYNAAGELVAVSRNLGRDQIPLSLSMELGQKLNDAWLTNLFEVSANGETAYYATIESATHITIYKTAGTAGWMVFKKDRK